MSDAALSGQLVTVVVVNYNSGQWLLRSLNALALQTHRPAKVFVVDNNSTDDSMSEIKAQFPEFECILLDKNIGFAAANNLAIDRCNTPLVALLNPDAYPEPEWLGALVEASAKYPKAASFGSLLLLADQPNLIDGVEDVYHASGLVWRGGHGRPINDGDAWGREIFSPCAAAALYRTDVLRQVGGFDEDFFCYLEDVDLGFRLRLDGWGSRFVPEAQVLHVGGATSGGRHSDFSIYHGHRNLTWAFVKNLPGPLLWLLLPLHILMSVVCLVHMAYIGQARIFLRSKRDAALGLPRSFEKRKKIQSGRKVSLLNVLAMLNLKLIPDRKLDRFNAGS